MPALWIRQIDRRPLQALGERAQTEASSFDDGLRHAATTESPRSRSCRTSSSPIPRFAPVTSAVLNLPPSRERRAFQWMKLFAAATRTPRMLSPAMAPDATGST